MQADFDCGGWDEEKAENVEKIAEEKLTEVQRGFRARKEKEKARFLENVDSEYWFCVCFQTREQKETFLAKMKWLEEGDKYLDGVEVARIQGLDMRASVPKPAKYKHDKTWNDLVMKTEDGKRKDGKKRKERR